MNRDLERRNSVIRTARHIRFGIWLLACVCAGALKSLYFPDGGWPLFRAGIVMFAVLTLFGILVERWIVRRWGQ
jgi:ABC-type branched-subunit amino acid transport system permease subunit